MYNSNSHFWQFLQLFPGKCNGKLNNTYSIYSYEHLNGTVISLLGFNNIAKVYTYQSTPNI